MTVAATVSPIEATRQEWPVVVVGAGPAGSLAAREVARRGMKVLLVDRSAFPRSKVCGCCLNRAALAMLRVAGLGELPSQRGAVSLHRIVLATAGRRASIPMDEAVALSRTTFDAALVCEAIMAGADFLAPATVSRSPTKDSSAILLRVQPETGSEQTLRARTLIAADGLNGRIAPFESPLEPTRASRIGAGVVLPNAPSEYPAGSVFMAVGRGGYVGLVRLEEGRLDVAAAFDPGFVRASRGPGLAAVSLLQSAGFPPIAGLESASWRGTPALTRSLSRVAGERWLAVGDAAGYVEPFTGEGMAWALASGIAVAPVAVRGSASWSEALAREWEATYARRIRSRQGVCRWAAVILRSPVLCELAIRILEALPILSRPVIARLSRPSPIPAGLRS